MFACFFGHKHIVQLFLDQSNKSIQLNAQDDSEATAFMSACQKGHKDVFKLLTNVPKH